MAEAPEIPRLIRERVHARQAGLRSPAEHPDADVLTAFSENTLAGEERALVMNHLGDCEACRDVVMLSEAVPEPDAQPARLAAPRFLSWMTLRWASLAAVFAMAIGVVVMERSSRQERNTPVQYASPSDVATPARTNEQERPTATTKADLASAGEKDAKLADARERGKTAAKPVAPAAPPQAYAAMRQNSIGRPLAGEAQSRSERAAGRESLSKEGFSAPSNAVAAKQEMIRNRGQLPVEVTNNYEAPAVVAGTGAAQDSARPAAQESEADGYATAPVAPPAASSPAGDVAAGTSRAAAPGAVAPPEQRLVRKKRIDEVTAKAAGQRSAAPALTREDKALAAQTQVTTSDNANLQAKGQQVGITTDNLAVAVPAPIRWRIHRGKLQRSADEGKTWQEVDLDPGVNLHSFWIQGGTVWAGGTGGSLFHLTSQGKDAVRVPLRVSSGDVSQTVVTISFSDERNGTIRLENGHILRTTDGGKTWERF